MKTFLAICILCSLSTICTAQKNKKGNGQAEGLSLDKKIPLEIKPYHKNRCVAYPLLKVLRDSLSKEGFTVVDSIKSQSLQMTFMDNLFKSALKDKNVEGTKARLDNVMKSKKVVQLLFVENFSCLDTLHNFTVRIYLFPRPSEEDMKSISFTLPFNSPYRISDVILSLIEREPSKK